MTDIKNRCVITGLGMINAIGNNVEECFNNAKKSVSGIEATTSVDTKDCYANLAAEVKQWQLRRSTQRSCSFPLCAILFYFLLQMQIYEFILT